MRFFERLEARARQIDSLLCVGLDPHPEDLPYATAEAALAYCLRLIEQTHETALVYKPNSAFFECYGSQGIRVLEQVLSAIPPQVPVILDAKRGDIASTAQAYAMAAFKSLSAHAVTVNPYLGQDSLQPFLEDPERGVFILCKTSNPGSADLQDLQVEGVPLYEKVARLAVAWNRNGNLGLVVGATQPEALARVRALAADMWILAPGIGAQGADLKRAVWAGLRRDGLGLLLPASRSIARSKNPRQAAADLQQAINAARRSYLERKSAAQPVTPMKTGAALAIARGLVETGCVRFGEFRLKSGLISPIYIDLRRLTGYPNFLAAVASAYLPLLSGLTFDRIAAIPYAGLPIATAISLAAGYPLVYPRKETKEYGTKAEVEGVFKAGERVVVIDDLATTGGSKLEAIDKLHGAGLQVEDVVVLIDRESGAREALAEHGCKLRAVFTLTELLDIWGEAEMVPLAEVEKVRNFVSANLR